MPTWSSSLGSRVPESGKTYIDKTRRNQLTQPVILNTAMKEAVVVRMIPPYQDKTFSDTVCIIAEFTAGLQEMFRDAFAAYVFTKISVATIQHMYNAVSRDAAVHVKRIREAQVGDPWKPFLRDRKRSGRLLKPHAYAKIWTWYDKAGSLTDKSCFSTVPRLLHTASVTVLSLSC
jgi:hypothetical protein